MTHETHFVAMCPICEQGLCRVRVCTDAAGQVFGCVVCDECESTWKDPTMKERFVQESMENPVCPHCGIRFWTESSRWADSADLALLGWYKHKIG